MGKGGELSQGFLSLAHPPFVYGEGLGVRDADVNAPQSGAGLIPVPLKNDNPENGNSILRRQLQLRHPLFAAVSDEGFRPPQGDKGRRVKIPKFITYLARFAPNR